TVATASKAASIAAVTDASLLPAASISTKVPSSGRARRTLVDAFAIGRQNSFHTFGDVGRRQRRAGDVADVAVDLQRAARGLADNLSKPARASDLAPVGFPIFQDFDALHRAGGAERHGVVDIEVLADHAIKHEQARDPAAGFGLP